MSYSKTPLEITKADFIVRQNNIRVEPNVTLGAKVNDNTLNLTGRAGIYAVELYSAWSNDISYNNIYANGSFSEVGLYGSSGNSITNNTIYSFGDGINDPAQGPEHPDSVSLIDLQGCQSLQILQKRISEVCIFIPVPVQQLLCPLLNNHNCHRDCRHHNQQNKSRRKIHKRQNRK